MALKRLTIEGKAVLELNQVAFRRDGRIEAQLPLNATDFATIDAEAGMALEINAGTDIKLPTSADALVGLHYTTEKLYNQFAQGLNNWSCGLVNGFLPRLGYLAKGDKFTTNCIAYLEGATGTDFAANEAAAKVLLAAAGTTPVYAIPGANGAWELKATLPTTATVLKVVKVTTIPDGNYGVQFITIKA